MADLKFAGALASLVLGVTTLAAPASAQFYERPWGPYRYNAPPPAFAPAYRDGRPLPPFEFVERLEARGFAEISRPRYDGSVYVLDATNPRGRRLRLVFDAFRGNIVDRYALDRPRDLDRGGEAPRRYADRPEPDMDETPIGNRRAIGPEPRGHRPDTDAVQGLNPHAAAPAEGRPEKKARARRPAGTPHQEAHRGEPTTVKRVPPARPEIGTATAAPPAAEDKAAPAEPQVAGAKPEPVPAEPPPAAISPKAPAPPVEAAKPVETAKPAATAEVDRSGKPVRVIKGVTPMDVGPQPDAELETLPAPPSVTPPTDLQ